MNLTDNIVFNQDLIDLDISIRDALRAVAEAYLDDCELTVSQLEDVTTKTHIRAAFPKFVFLGALKSPLRFDQEYLQFVFKLYQTGHKEWSANDIEVLFGLHKNSNLVFKRTFTRVMKPAIGIFLLRLHINKILNLPAAFNWPTNRTKISTAHRVILRVVEESELLALFASLSKTSTPRHGNPFEQIIHNEKTFDWFRTYGMKLLLAAGWLEPEEVSLGDLQKVSEIINVRGIGRQVAQVFLYAFGNRCSLTPDDLKLVGRREKPQSDIYSKIFATQTSTDVFDLLSETRDVAFARPDRLSEAARDFPFECAIQNWIELQVAFLKYSKYENSKGPSSSLAIFNLYMFFYLPRWFKEHPDTAISFPDIPAKLVGSIFISRVGTPKIPMPRTFIEFANVRADRLAIRDTTQYSRTKVIEIFFDFVIERADEFPEAAGFKQPFGKKDHASLTSAPGTNKRPIPRRLYSAFINTTEAILAYFYVITDLVVNAAVDNGEQGRLAILIGKSDWGYTDTFLVADKVGYIPVIFHKDKTIPIRYIHPSINAEWMRLNDGHTRYVPRPHAIAQIATAEYSGLRHNHIQWLDERIFDSQVGDALADYCSLVVNTDKAKGKAWVPIVNYRVIEILRSQRKWRDLIGEAGFRKDVKYNNNPDSKYPAFRPLFSYSKDGLPHPDSTYSAAWKDLLRTFSVLLPELAGDGNFEPSRLFQLRPPGVMYNDPNAEVKLSKFGSASNVCPLILQTEITPHSTRVSVVGNLLTYLPAELIGKRFTGQSTPTVLHYFVPDPDDILDLEIAQKNVMQRRAIEQQFSNEVFGNGDAAYIKADTINSKLATSMRANLDESLVRYGCISIMVVEDGPTGLDLLKREGISSAAFNKTEVCPYDNNCPASIIALLRGVRKCAVCPAAVRSIDHLPAVCAKRKQTQERVLECERELAHKEAAANMTDKELNILEDCRHELYEELAAWTIVEGCLEYVRKTYSEGQTERTWLIAEPEILRKKLMQTEIRSGSIEYLLTRLQECLAYPSMQSPILSKQLDLLRRRLLAQAGDFDTAFTLDVPIDAAAECAGVLRNLASSHNLTPEQVFELMTRDDYLLSFESKSTLSIEYEEIINV